MGPEVIALYTGAAFIAGLAAHFIFRYAGVLPLLGKVVGKVLSVRRELDVDRDRIVKGLRDEINDLNRRMGRLEQDNDELRSELVKSRAENATLKRENESLRRRVTELEEYIGRALRMSGLTPPPPPQTRPPARARARGRGKA